MAKRYGSRGSTIRATREPGLLDQLSFLDILGMVSPERLTAILGEPTNPMTAYAADIDRDRAFAAQDRINRLRPQRVLSLFDGLGAARVALDRLGIPVGEYLSSEIDPYAKGVLQKNYPDSADLGDVRGIKADQVGEVDLMCGGSPCQDLSRGNVGGKGLEGDRSSLFWEYKRLKDEVQPRNFVFENVIPKGSMQSDDVKIIRDALEAEPIILDAKEVSSMSRPRMFFTNMPIDPSRPESIPPFRDLLDAEVPEKYQLSDRAVDYMNRPAGKSGRTHFERHGYDVSRPTARTVPRVMYKGVPYNAVRMEDGSMRRFTPTEVERLFGLPDDYTAGPSDTRRYMMLGNSMSVPVLEKIFKGLL